MSRDKNNVIKAAQIHEMPAISKRTGLSIEWLSLWYEVEMFYGDVQKKETREQLCVANECDYFRIIY